MNELDQERLVFAMKQEAAKKKKNNKEKKITGKKLVADLSNLELRQIFYFASKEAKVALQPGTMLERKIEEILKLLTNEE